MGKIGIEPIMFTTRERIYSPPQHRQSLPLSHNPDSRVSKVFNVSCLPRVVSDILSIYLLQGGAYCLCERASHIDSDDTCRKLHPLFNLQKVSVSIKDTHQRKEESMKKIYVKRYQPLTNLPYEYIVPQTFQKVVVHVLVN